MFSRLFLLFLFQILCGLLASPSIADGPACAYSIPLAPGSGEITTMTRVSADSDLLITSSRLENSLKVWSLKQLKLVGAITFENPKLFGVLVVVELPNQELAIGSMDKRLRIYSLKDNKLLHFLDLPQTPIGISYSSKTSSLYVQLENSLMLTLQLSDLKKFKTWEAKVDGIGNLLILNDGLMGVATGESGSAFLCNLNAEKMVNKLNGTLGFQITKVIQLENGILIAGDLEGNIFFWNIKLTPGVFKKLKAHNRAVLDLHAYGPEEFISISLDGAVKLWEMDFENTIQEKALSLFKGEPKQLAIVDRLKGVIAAATIYQGESIIEIASFRSRSKIINAQWNRLEATESLLVTQAGSTSSKIFFAVRGKRRIEAWNSSLWRTIDSLKAKDDVLNIKGISEESLIYTLASGEVFVWTILPSNTQKRIENIKSNISNIDSHATGTFIQVAIQTADDQINFLSLRELETESEVIIKETSRILRFMIVDNSTLLVQTKKNELNLWRLKVIGGNFELFQTIQLNESIHKLHVLNKTHFVILHNPKSLKIYSLVGSFATVSETDFGFSISGMAVLNDSAIMLASKEKGSIGILTIEVGKNFSMTKEVVKGVGNVRSMVKLRNEIVFTTDDGNMKYFDLNIVNCRCSNDFEIDCICQDEPKFKVRTHESGLTCSDESINFGKNGVKSNSTLALEYLLIFLLSLIVLLTIILFYRRKRRREASLLIKKSDFL